MELRGFEPLTFSLRTRRATNCANAPTAQLSYHTRAICVTLRISWQREPIRSGSPSFTSNITKGSAQYPKLSFRWLTTPFAEHTTGDYRQSTPHSPHGNMDNTSESN